MATTKLKPLDGLATAYAETLVAKIRKKGWAGSVALVGTNKHGGHSCTGAGTGLDLSADAMGALEVFLNVGKYFKKDRDWSRMNELLVMIRDRINEVWPELLEGSQQELEVAAATVDAFMVAAKTGDRAHMTEYPETRDWDRIFKAVSAIVPLQEGSPPPEVGEDG